MLPLLLSVEAHTALLLAKLKGPVIEDHPAELKHNLLHECNWTRCLGYTSQNQTRHIRGEQ